MIKKKSFVSQFQRGRENYMESELQYLGHVRRMEHMEHEKAITMLFFPKNIPRK